MRRVRARARTCVSQHGYCVRLGKLPATARSPKEDILWGWPASAPGSATLQRQWSTSSWPAELRRCGYDLVLRRETDEPSLSRGGDDSTWALELLTPDTSHQQRDLLLTRLQPLLAQRDGGASACGIRWYTVVSTSERRSRPPCAADRTVRVCARTQLASHSRVIVSPAPWKFGPSPRLSPPISR
jgi:hypothetical protein